MLARTTSSSSYIYIYFISSRNLGFEIAVPGREREQGGARERHARIPESVMSSIRATGISIPHKDFPTSSIAPAIASQPSASIPALTFSMGAAENERKHDDLSEWDPWV